MTTLAFMNLFMNLASATRIGKYDNDISILKEFSQNDLDKDLFASLKKEIDGSSKKDQKWTSYKNTDGKKDDELYKLFESLSKQDKEKQTTDDQARDILEYGIRKTQEDPKVTPKTKKAETSTDDDDIFDFWKQYNKFKDAQEKKSKDTTVDTVGEEQKQETSIKVDDLLKKEKNPDKEKTELSRSTTEDKIDKVESKPGPLPEKTVPTRTEQKNQLPPNTQILGQSLECISGYISDGVIDYRGCWKCDDGCSPNSKCAYPGLCFVPVPSIITVNRRTGLGSNRPYTLNYKIDSGSYSPIEAYCKFDNVTIQAQSVTEDVVICNPPGGRTYSNLRMSFDKNGWSQSAVINSKDSTTLFWLLIITGGIAVVLVITLIARSAGWCKKNKSFSGDKFSVPSPIAPMAYFPTIESASA